MNLKVVFSFLFLSFLASSFAAEFNPYVVGPYPDVLDFHWQYTGTGLYKNVEVFAPKNASGSFPVIYFSHSFAGTITVMSVKSWIQRLASYGYTVMAPWRVTSANYTVEWIDPLIDYTVNNIKSRLLTAGAEADYEPDFSRMIFIGHSAGNHIGVNYFKRKGCRDFKASILLSPVDGPLDFSTTPGQFVNYEMPTLVMKAGLDPIPGQLLYPPCGPEASSNIRFYNAMPSNKWFLNATDFGHADFFEPEFFDLVDNLNFCAQTKEGDIYEYRDFVAGSCLAFIDAMLNRDNCEMLKYVEDPSYMIVNTTSVIRSVDDATRCESYCRWTPEAEAY